MEILLVVGVADHLEILLVVQGLEEILLVDLEEKEEGITNFQEGEDFIDDQSKLNKYRIYFNIWITLILSF